jgi:hypothetical protein
VKRQGEWFAIPRADLTDTAVMVLAGVKNKTALRATAKQGALPRRLIERAGSRDFPLEPGVTYWQPQGAQHVCPHLVTSEGVFLGRGVLYHRPEGFRARAQHRALRMREVWHVLVKNTERFSWSVDGRVD